MKRALQLLGMATAIVLLTAGSCSSDGDSAAAVAEVDSSSSSSTAAETSTTDTDTGSGGNTGTADTNADTSGGSGDFQTIWGIPPFGNATVIPGFGEYSVIDDDFQFSETVFFQVDEASADQVLDFYRQVLREQGQPFSELQLGESVGLNLDDDDPTTSGIIQVAPTGSGVTVNQERSFIKTNPDDLRDDEAPDVGTDATSDDAVSDSSSDN